ncbi:hypothetical protein IQ270_17185 [Microcoleus sp. LEGE 07076]|uniref:hypothetical protein n=1 Tax=Microcoleus sp. LEGE 07076 TaxID=915322 RepID=UPI00187E089D|nr:hypothetical protein [Microcoleus sp. LEGE 07076]MBE9186370.1 hypothetical protein [Microcoleus sp. LEGE 07076]
MRFIDGIYKPCVEKCKNIQDIPSVLSILDNGKAVLDDNRKCDRYIAFYGGHHFHKLYAAFASTNFRYTESKDIEIIDWGCGQGLATCVLIDYLIDNNINPNIVSVTLIEPSLIALNRGNNFTRQMLQSTSSSRCTIRKVNKYIDDLTANDLASEMGTIKVHLFSNIIDVEAFSLNDLHRLILASFQGSNRLICTSPDSNGKYRLDDFSDLFSQSCQLVNSASSDLPIYQEVFYFKNKQYERCRIGRCERQFTVNLT